MSLLRRVIVVSLFSMAIVALAQQPKDVASTFANPPKQYGPLVRWWWPGNDVDTPELQREIEMMNSAGFAGAEIQPFDAGVVSALSADATRRLNDYPSPNFFNHVADAIEAAKQHGMFIDYTFGSGWPFGGAEITPELTTVELRWSHQSLHGPGLLRTRLEVPAFTPAEQNQLRRMSADWQQRLENRAKIVAVVAVRGSDAIWNLNQSANDPAVAQTGVLTKDAVILTDKMQPDGTLEWNIPAGTWQVFVFRSMPTLHRVHHGAGAPIQLEMDHWNKAAFEAHAKAIGDDGAPIFGKYFGDGMRAIFCDSLEIANNFYWSDDFIEQFKRRRGYDITPYLPILKTYGKGPRSNTFDNLQAYDIPREGDAIRRDYEQTLSELMIENFFNPFNAWAHDHHLLARVQSHGAAADISKIYRDADIPETEDLAEGGTYQFLKLASSAAHISGKHQVGSESFVWAGAAWQSTPLKIKRAADELLTAGVNAILYHGYAYRIPGFAAPGWAPFATPERKGGNFSESYNEQNTFWPYLPSLNEYIRRVQYISQTGTNVAQVAFFRNALSYDRHDLPAVPEPIKHAVMSSGYNYDDIDEDSLLYATVASKTLHTAAGTNYSVLILPSMQQISAALATKLHEFASLGLPIIFAGDIPEQPNTLLDLKKSSMQFQTSLKSTLAAKNVHHLASPQQVTSVLNTIEVPNVRFDGEALPYLESTIGKMHFFFFRNATDEAKDATVHLHASGKLEEWDPWTGHTTRLTESGSNAVTIAHLHVDPVGSAMLVVTPVATATESALQRKTIATLPIGNQGWQLTATGMGPQGKTETIKRTMPLLTDWTSDPDLKFLSGNGVYTTTFDAPTSAPGQHIELQLGTVGDAATIKVNGKPAGQTILPPYAVDITNLLQPGHNTVEITVTNAFYNALSQRKPEVFSPGKTYTNSGLLSSGLIGPVTLVTLQ